MNLAAKKMDISMLKNLNHNQIYNQKYYRNVESNVKSSSLVIANTIIDLFTLDSLIDIGCGTCSLLENIKLISHNTFILGLDYSDESIKICDQKNIPVIKYNLEQDNLRHPYPLISKFSLVVSTEVAEHIPEKYSDSYVNLMTTLSDNIFFTAAHPNQGGTDHINEKPKEYWIDLFKKYNFEIQQELSDKISKEWKELSVKSWYYDNLMIFKKEIDT